DVLAGQKLAEVDISIAALVGAGFLGRGVMLLDHLLGRFAAADRPVPVAGAFLVDVANGDDLRAGIVEEAADVAEPHVAAADGADGDAPAGWRLVVAAESRRRHD